VGSEIAADEKSLIWLYRENQKEKNQRVPFCLVKGQQKKHFGLTTHVWIGQRRIGKNQRTHGVFRSPSPFANDRDTGTDVPTSLAGPPGDVPLPKPDLHVPPGPPRHAQWGAKGRSRRRVPGRVGGSDLEKKPGVEIPIIEGCLCVAIDAFDVLAEEAGDELRRQLAREPHPERGLACCTQPP